MERRGARRFTGPRALAAEGALFIAGVAAACSPNTPAETQKPTILPTESPVPTMTIAPTESPLITPTPEPTLSPTPEATKTPITSIIEKKPPVVSYSTLKTVATEAFNNNPQAETIISKAYFDTTLENCSGLNGAGMADRQAGCFGVIFSFYKLYLATDDPNALNASKDGYDYAVSSKGPYYKNKADLDSKLKSVFP